MVGIPASHVGDWGSIPNGEVGNLLGFSSMVFPVVMYGCESWTVKKAEHRKIDAFELWCWRRLLTARRRRDSLDCKEVQPAHPKGDQPWVFIGRTDAEAETPILWPPGAKSWLIGKDPDAGRDWGRRRRGQQRWDGWMASPTRWTLLVCCDSWGRKESDTTERLNWTELNELKRGIL